MARQHGITQNTPNRLVLDSGALFVNYGEANVRRLGATRGGAVFNLQEERREIPVDGALGPVSELRRVVRAVPVITCTLLEFSLENWRILIPQLTEVASGDWTILKRLGSQILPQAFVPNISLVAEVAKTETPVIIKLFNAFVEGNLSLTLVDKDEGTIPITVTGHFSLGDLETQPWELHWPVSAT